MEKQYDLIVIGAGPGGYVSAIKAAQLGMKTAIIENREIGGTCLNRGCIPTKTLMHSSHIYYEAQSLENIGLQIQGIHFDMNKILDRKDEVVEKIQSGIVSLLKANGVTILTGTASIINSNQVQVKTVIDEKGTEEKGTEEKGTEEKGTEEKGTEDAATIATEEIASKVSETIETYILHTHKILIASGSKPAIPPIEGITLDNVITSDELLSVRDKFYQKLVIIGGGVIGVEFATIYRELGCDVEIIEAMERILPTMDKEISQSIAMNLKKKGIVIHTKAKVLRITENVYPMDHKLSCEYVENNGSKIAEADGILISVGRKANTDGLFTGEFTVDMNKDKIMVDGNFETSVKGVYAIGDVIGGIQLAHAASAQGITAVEKMCNEEPAIDLNCIPSCIYTSPEVASVGLTEAEAKEKGYEVKTGKYPMLGNCKTILSMGDRGYMKIICDSETDKIIGAQLICDRATDIISELATAIVNGLTVKDLSSVIRPHPTYAEGITEAVEDMNGLSIHLIPKNSKKVQ